MHITIDDIEVENRIGPCPSKDVGFFLGSIRIAYLTWIRDLNGVPYYSMEAGCVVMQGTLETCKETVIRLLTMNKD